jgi:hypothetical protein
MDASIFLPVLMGSIITIVFTVVINALITSHSRGKTEGVIETSVAGLDRRVTQNELDIRELDRQQQNTNRDLASLSGSPRGKAAQTYARKI